MISRPSTPFPYFFWRAFWVFVSLVLVTLTGAFVAVAPLWAVILFGIVAGVIVIWWLYGPGPWWSRAMLCVLGGSLILGQGFSNASIGGGGLRLPITELVLLLCLFVFFLSYRWRDLLGGLDGALLLICALFPLFLHLAGDVFRYGIVSVRDATHYVDMWAFVVGVGFAQSIAAGRIPERTWSKFLLFLFVIAALYGLSYPIRDLVAGYSPRVMGYQQRLPVFGYYNMVNITAFSVLMFAVIATKKPMWPGLDQHKNIIKLMAGLSAVCLLVMQTRAIFVGLAVVVVILFALGWRREVFALIVIGLIALLGFELASAYGVGVSGKLGEIGFATAWDMLVSIFGQGDLRGAAHGTHQRLSWWSQLIFESVESPERFLFGRGFGEPLTDFFAPGEKGQVIVREPHNSYLSVYARAGLLVFITWIVFKLRIYWCFFSSYLRASDDYPRKGFVLWVALFILVNDLRALVEPVYEFPYGAVPIYFIIGFTLVFIRREDASIGVTRV